MDSCETLTPAEERARQAAPPNQDAIYVTLVSREGKIVWVSDTINGLAAEDVIGMPVWSSASPESAEEIRSAFVHALAGDTVTQTVSAFLAGALRHFRSVWRPANVSDDVAVVISTIEEMPSFRQLSERQKTVLRCFTECDSNSHAAQRLGLSERTVESHLRNIRRIVGIETRQGLMAYALHHFVRL